MKHSSKADNRPAFLFFPDDWLAEPGLRACDLSARGLWIDLICFMFRMSKRGKLIVQNKHLTEQEISNLVGRPLAEVQAALEQLIKYQVAGITTEGTIYSRRMVREEKQRLSKIRAGRKGGLSTWASKEGSKAQAKGGSSSSSSSSSSNKDKSTLPAGKPPRKRDAHADAFKERWDKRFPQAPYVWKPQDFPQKARWQKHFPLVTADAFGDLAAWAWGHDEYTMNAASTIAALCTNWPQLVVKRGEGAARDRPSVKYTNLAGNLAFVKSKGIDPQDIERIVKDAGYGRDHAEALAAFAREQQEKG